MAGETLTGERNFGVELRQATGDKQEQRRLLREMVMEAGGIDEDAARRVFDAFQDAEIVFITEEGWERNKGASESLQRLGNLVDRLYPSD